MAGKCIAGIRAINLLLRTTLTILAGACDQLVAIRPDDLALNLLIPHGQGGINIAQDHWFRCKTGTVKDNEM
jgi:hypothetical protein